MQQRLNANFRCALAVLVVTSTLGMELDVFSGPLPAAQGLAFVLDLVVTCTDGSAAVQDEAASGHNGSGDHGKVPGETPRGSVHVADWPAPCLVVKCRQQVRRSIAFEASACGVRPRLVSYAGASGTASLPVPSGGGSDRLSRLNC